MRRRRFLLLLPAVAALAVAPRVLGDEPTVPVGLQAELLLRAAAYDREMGARARPRLSLLLVTAKGDAGSVASGAAFRRALGVSPQIAGVGVDLTEQSFEGVAALAARCRAGVAVVVLSSGLAAAVPELARALEGANLLSVALVADDVSRGAVLGFDLVSGRPKLVVHLSQAQKQQVRFNAQLLKLARVIGR
ncbi:MAG: YfiR family protein [Deltaproteobacteria bacterium]|nr:YfiR family protein [Deltaproteobacteria bacterium]